LQNNSAAAIAAERMIRNDEKGLGSASAQVVQFDQTASRHLSFVLLIIVSSSANFSRLNLTTL
jgi:hypothetical protein